MFNPFKKRKKLKQGLNEVLNALERNIIHHDWANVQSCNCGLIVQALLNSSPGKVKELFLKEVKKTNLETSSTWRKLTKERCIATGLPMEGIFKTLYSHGFRPEDIVHLEYLENKSILNKTDIDTSVERYFEKKENLIKYLKAWLKILNEDNISTTQVEDKDMLEKQLLREVNKENYLQAAKIRDKINSLT